MRTTQKILNGGKVTIPKVIREEMGIEEGDTIELDIQKVGDDA